MDLSIIISDGVLSIVALYVTIVLCRSQSIANQIAALGIAIIGLTSFIGFINHFGIKETEPLGGFFGGLSNYLGVPLIGIAYTRILLKRNQLIIFIILSFLTIYLLSNFITFSPFLPTILGGIAMLTIVSVCLSKVTKSKRFALFGTMAAILIMTAGLVIGMEGTLGFFLRLDLFHYTIAVAILCFKTSLQSKIRERRF